jgi:IPT/TIG domain/Regulator of chromosome condensation (RCC1) repeat
MAWGEDKYGELGTGVSGEPSEVPVALSALGEITGIAAGGYHDLAYGEGIPTVSRVSPSVGPTAGGTTVTVTGSGFKDVSAVRFGSSNATSFTVTSPTSITAVSPPGTPSSVDVTVIAAAGTSPTGAGDRFEYLSVPTIKKLAPKSGPTGGGTMVTITGTELAGASAVSFGATAATNFTVTSATSIAVEAPPGALGTVAVTVTTPGGASVSSSHTEFKYKK